MAINLRRIGVNTFVIETSRQNGKVVTTHLGSYKNPFARLLYRKSELQKAVASQLQHEARIIRKECREIEPSMKLLAALSNRFFVFVRLANRHPQEQSTMPKSRSRRQATKPGATKTDATKPDQERINEALRVLPAKHAFGRLCRQADSGDPEAIKKLDELIEQAPGLLDSMGDLVRFARESVLRGISKDSVVFTEALRSRIQLMEDKIKADLDEDPILGMAAEVVAVTYLDAMRCEILALSGQEYQTDAEHI